jgi:hypothetical protein
LTAGDCGVRHHSWKLSQRSFAHMLWLPMSDSGYGRTEPFEHFAGCTKNPGLARGNQSPKRTDLLRRMLHAMRKTECAESNRESRCYPGFVASIVDKHLASR